MKIKINKKEYKAKPGQTVLEIAKQKGIKIPSLCYHSDIEPSMSCRLCLVKVKGKKGLFTACSLLAEDGMEITTKDKEIEQARKTNLELLFSQHKEECFDCVYKYNCYLLKLAKEYDVEITRFKDRKTDYPVHRFGPALIFDSSKCIDCRNCVDICQQQGVGFLKVEKGKKEFLNVVPDKNKECIYCGQCLVHCPVGAFEGVGEFEEIEKPFKDKNKTVVFQIAPSIRSSIGEEFGMNPGEVVTGKIATAVRKIGADKIFDVSVGADITTVEEAREFVQRKKDFPMFTSCCPAWVRFVEVYYPEFTKNLTTVRSPHIILGGLIKTYWAKKQGLDPKDIVVVSIMPCISKKYEITRKELFLKNNIKPVDFVLTTRELAFLLKEKKIDLKKLKEEELDDPLGLPSGAGVIYGASGGVMESALRTAHKEITGKDLGNIETKEVRGLDGIKEAKVKVGKRTIKIAVTSGTGNAKNILEKLKEKPNLYDYVEVMACPGGCIGGGGQPMPTDKKTRKKRAQGLYSSDKKKKVRLAHENPIVKELYEEFLGNKENIHKICHTKFIQKQ